MGVGEAGWGVCEKKKSVSGGFWSLGLVFFFVKDVGSLEFVLFLWFS